MQDSFVRWNQAIRVHTLRFFRRHTPGCNYAWTTHWCWHSPFGFIQLNQNSAQVSSNTKQQSGATEEIKPGKKTTKIQGHHTFPFCLSVDKAAFHGESSNSLTVATVLSTASCCTNGHYCLRGLTWLMSSHVVQPNQSKYSIFLHPGVLTFWSLEYTKISTLLECLYHDVWFNVYWANGKIFYSYFMFSLLIELGQLWTLKGT